MYRKVLRAWLSNLLLRRRGDQPSLHVGLPGLHRGQPSSNKEVGHFALFKLRVGALGVVVERFKKLCLGITHGFLQVIEGVLEL